MTTNSLQTSDRYSRIQIALHWGTLLLLIGSFISHEGIKDAWRVLRRGGEVDPSFGALAHVWLGVAVLVLTAVRIAVRLKQGAPIDNRPTPRAQQILAKAAHLGLYGLLIALPGTGALAWFAGYSDLSDAHEILFNVALGVLALHVLGALYHQYYLKDGLLKRMR